MSKAAKEKDNKEPKEPREPKEKFGPLRHRKVGAYRVLTTVGKGGMAQVYRGVHEQLQREVAIKELLPDAVDRESISRFRREALALAAFRHQNIVTLYDLVDKNEALFMILEFVDGPTLADLIKEGPLPPLVAAVIGARVASALDHAHFAHIIHRDIKPSNIMITKAGEVKLMDFGIAKDEGLEALTRQGLAVGTPSYMSPEQVTGRTVDARTDLFSLGVVLYECLTGQKPFAGKTAAEVFSKIRDGRCTPLKKAIPTLRRGLRIPVERCMRTSPDRRYPDAAELRRDLEVYLAKEVAVSHAAVLVAFLRQRKRMTETEVKARLNERELTLVESFGAFRRGSSRVKWMLAGAGAGGAGLLYATRPLWQHLLR